jgi:hypothetical protein
MEWDKDFKKFVELLNGHDIQYGKAQDVADAKQLKKPCRF